MKSSKELKNITKWWWWDKWDGGLKKWSWQKKRLPRNHSQRPPDVNSRLIGKDPDAGKAWRKEEKGATADEMVGWHHRPNGHEFEQTLRYSYRQGNLAWCSPWDSRDGRDWATEQQQQKHLPDKWQSQDPIVPSTIAIFEVCGHLITVWILSLFYY